MEHVKHGRRINGVIGCLFKESFASSGNQLSDGWFGNLMAERIGDSAKCWQEHTTLRIRATVQTIFDWNVVAVGTNEVTSWHMSTSKESESPNRLDN
ncbi:MAG: hypothetical protein IJQ82_05360 [Selenomonadaceae bacterium]|nr:hypothetical protein [Selenomonadaceae bacterium]